MTNEFNTDVRLTSELLPIAYSVNEISANYRKRFEGESLADYVSDFVMFVMASEDELERARR